MKTSNIGYAAGGLLIALYKQLEYGTGKTATTCGYGARIPPHGKLRVYGSIGGMAVATFFEWFNAHHGLHWINVVRMCGYAFVALNGVVYNCHFHIMNLKYALAISDLIVGFSVSVFLAALDGSATAAVMVIQTVFHTAENLWPDKTEAAGFKWAGTVLAMFFALHWCPGVQDLYSWAVMDEAIPLAYVMMLVQLMLSLVLTTFIQYQISPGAPESSHAKPETTRELAASAREQILHKTCWSAKNLLLVAFSFSFGAITAHLWSGHLLGNSENTRTDSASAVALVRAAQLRPRVVVSFTTFPVGSRMSGVANMLSSMDNQTWRPDKVIINFPDRVERLSTGPLSIPTEAEAWTKQYSWLSIHQTKDFGPATKLLGALQIESAPDTILVILDDDTYYHHDTVLALVSTMLASPIDIAPCFACERVWRDGGGKSRWGYQEKEGQCNGFASGFASYAVRPRYFDASVWDYSIAPKGCRLHDDVWVSGRMLSASGARPYVVRPGFDSGQWDFARDAERVNESVHAAHKAAEEQGYDPQGACVEFFDFSKHDAPARTATPSSPQGSEL